MADNPEVQQPAHLPPQWEWAKRSMYFVQAGEEPMAGFQSSWLSDRSQIEGCAPDTHTILTNIKMESAGRNGVGWMNISIEAPNKNNHYQNRPFQGVPMFLSENQRRLGPVNVPVLRTLVEDEEALNNHEQRLLKEIERMGNNRLSAFIAFNVAEEWGRGLDGHDTPGFVRRNGLSMKEIEVLVFVLTHLEHSLHYNQALHGIFGYINQQCRNTAIDFCRRWIQNHGDEVDRLRTYLLTNVKTTFVALAQPYLEVNVEEHIEEELNRNE